MVIIRRPQASRLRGGKSSMITPSKHRAAVYLLTLTVLTGTFPGCTVTPTAPPPSAQPSAADMSFDEISNRYLHDMLALSPVQATSQGDHRYDEMLDDVSAAGDERRTSLARELLGQLRKVDKPGLSRAHQVDAQLLINQLEYQIWNSEQLQQWRWDPLLYTDLAGNSVYLLMARSV